MWPRWVGSYRYHLQLSSYQTCSMVLAWNRPYACKNRFVLKLSTEGERSSTWLLEINSNTGSDTVVWEMQSAASTTDFFFDFLFLLVPVIYHETNDYTNHWKFKIWARWKQFEMIWYASVFAISVCNVIRRRFSTDCKTWVLCDDRPMPRVRSVYCIYSTVHIITTEGDTWTWPTEMEERKDCIE